MVSNWDFFRHNVQIQKVMKNFYILLVSLLVLSCSKNDNEGQNQQSDWLVDEADITGLLSLYPLIVNPEFTSVSESNIADNVVVGVVNFGSAIRVYPYSYMSTVEIVNDEYNGRKYAFSYCPITKSSVAFNREQTFRASGYLYKENLTPWDSETESIWSQMLLKGIRGTNKNVLLNTIPVLETTFGTIRQNYPNAKVLMVTNSESNRAPDPPDDDDSDNDNVPDVGELAYGILDGFGSIDIFRFSDFYDSSILKVTIRGQDYVVYGNSSKHVFNAFKVSSNDNFEALDADEFPNVVKDSNGVKYDILGRGNNGTNLEKPKYAYVAIWRAWDDFYDDFIFQ